MGELSDQQREVIELKGDVFVIACPGSGKTRVLTEKIAATLSDGIPPYKRIAAVTFTNRAADEIAVRLQESGFSRKHLWTGTIHSFALEWILRPYASYDEVLSKGFAVADALQTRKQLEALKDKHGVQYVEQCRLAISRDGTLLAKTREERNLVAECRELLQAQKLIDFDCVLYFAYSLLLKRPEIATTLGAIFGLICVDEYQDTQDLQFGILSAIVRASNNNSRVFIVGDKNQAIYESLGGIAKTVQEIKDEFDRPDLHYRELSGNYRSTQRIVDFCAGFCGGDGTPIESLAKHSHEQGIITFSDQSCHKDQLADEISRIVQYHLESGVKAEDICILGPAWWLVTALGRQLVIRLPNIDLDAPGLSPLRYQPDSTWFKLARLFLSDPTPSRYRTRCRWAGDLLVTLEGDLGRELPEQVRSPRAILRLVNAIESEQESGLAYLEEVFEKTFAALEINLELHPEFLAARQSFFDGAEERLIDRGENEIESVENLRKMFRYPSGAVINTCHGIKGEEFTVVICFGLLKGYIPHWGRIYDPHVDASEEAKRIIYVVASRAKMHLHLFSEHGRNTKRGVALVTTDELRAAAWDYDDLTGHLA